MKYLLVAIIALLIFALSIYKYFLVRKFPKEAVVERVIDGDTVEIEGGHIVRYIGIDAPEIRRKDKEDWIYDPQPFAKEAKFLNQKLVEGKKVKLEYDTKRKDKYNRLLAYIYIGNVFVNGKIIREGCALTYIFPPNIKYANQLVKAEKEAKDNNRGFWPSVKFHPISSVKAGDYIGKIKIVEGRVRDVYKGERVIRLNFGTDWKSDFHVTIFRNMLDRFEAQGISPISYYKGKKIKVRGLIKNFDGCPEIVIDDPSQIEVLINKQNGKNEAAFLPSNKSLERTGL